MMKRQTCFFLLMCLSFLFPACGESVEETPPEWTVEQGKGLEISPTALTFYKSTLNHPHTAVITVKNTSGLPITITNIQIDEMRNDADIEYELQLFDGANSFFLDAGKSMSMAVVYRPANVYLDTANVVITSTDPIEPVRKISLVGSVEYKRPDLSLPKDIEFDQTQINQFTSKLSMIRNLGNAPLQLYEIESNNPNVFTISYPDPDHLTDFTKDRVVFPGTIGPKTDMPVRFWFKPLTAGEHLASVFVRSSDGEFPEWTIRLKGQGR